MIRKAFWLVLISAAGMQPATAEFITTATGTGQDVQLQRNNVTIDDGFLRVKNQSGNLENSGNDRVALLKFDLSALSENISSATVRLETPRGASTTPPTVGNTFDAGETIYLYGVPDNAGENANLTTVTWANSPYLTGTFSAANPRPVSDMTGNNVNDTLATLLGSFTWPAQSNVGDTVSISGAALTSFLQADTNDIATFIVTVSQSNATKTPVFGSSSAATPRPTLLTNADAIPEPSTLGLALVAGMGALAARRRG